MRLFLTTLFVLALLSTSALATDLYSSTKDTTNIRSDIWTGCGVSGYAGLGVGTIESKNIDSTSNRYGNEKDLSMDGFAGGLGVGCDQRVDNYVFGIYADYMLLGVEHEHTNVNPTGVSREVELDSKWSIGFRAGYLVNPYTLAYGKIGYSQTEAEATWTYNDSGAVLSGEEDLSGFDIGGGVEMALNSNLFLGADYTYTALSDEDAIDRSLDPDLHVVRVGLTYKFYDPQLIQ